MVSPSYRVRRLDADVVVIHFDLVRTHRARCSLGCQPIHRLWRYWSRWIEIHVELLESNPWCSIWSAELGLGLRQLLLNLRRVQVKQVLSSLFELQEGACGIFQQIVVYLTSGIRARHIDHHVLLLHRRLRVFSLLWRFNGALSQLLFNVLNIVGQIWIIFRCCLRNRLGELVSTPLLKRQIPRRKWALSLRIRSLFWLGINL